MENAISMQTLEFLSSAVLGIALGVFYDILKVIRSYTKRGKGITSLFDVIFWTVSIFSLFVFVLTVAGGRMRWYILIGAFCGCFVYRAFVGEIVFKVLRGTSDILAKLLRVSSRPIYLFLRKTRGLLEKTVKKISRMAFLHKKKRNRKADELGNKKTKKEKKHFS